MDLLIASSSIKNSFRFAAKLVAVIGAVSLVIWGYIYGPTSAGMLVYGHVFAALTSALWLGLNRWRVLVMIVWFGLNLISAVGLFGTTVSTKNTCAGNPHLYSDVEF